MKLQSARCNAHLSIAVGISDAGASSFFVYQMILDRPISVDLPLASEIKIFENCRGMFGSEIQLAVIDGNTHLPARAHNDFASCAHGHDQNSNRKIPLRRGLLMGRVEDYIDMTNAGRELAAEKHISTVLLCAAKIILDVNDTSVATVKVKHPEQGQVFDLAGGATILLSYDAPRQFLPWCSSSNCGKQQPASKGNRTLPSYVSSTELPEARSLLTSTPTLLQPPTLYCQRCQSRCARLYHLYGLTEI